MKKQKFVVLNSKNQLIKCCKTYYEAQLVLGNHEDWIIISYFKAYPTGLTTGRQRSAVAFIEEVLNIEFTGDLYDWKDVSPFLGDYLEIAKQTYDELKCEFEADRGY